MQIISCPECNQQIVECDNKVRLDWPAVPWDGGHAQWTIMQLGGLIATTGDPDPQGNAHTLHEHQPSDGPMS